MLLSLVAADRTTALSGKINQDPDVSNVVEQAKNFLRQRAIWENHRIGAGFCDCGGLDEKGNSITNKRDGNSTSMFIKLRILLKNRKSNLELATFWGKRKKGKAYTKHAKKIGNVTKKSLPTKERKVSPFIYTSFETTSGKENNT